MTIPTKIFDEQEVLRMEGLFVPEIDHDPWVIYHGTSQVREATIDREGFCLPSFPFNRMQLESILQLFDWLRWDGLSEAKGVVEAWSLNHAHREGNEGAIFFAGTSIEALTFASHAFAGGEKLYSVRGALAELHQFMASDELRRNHWAAQEKKYRRMVAEGFPSDWLRKNQPVEIDLPRLQAELEALEPLRAEANAIQDRHAYGLVYAVRLEPSDLASLKDQGGMGILATRPIPAERILGKVIIPRDKEPKRWFSTPMHPYHWEMGVLFELHHASNSKVN